MAKKTLYIAYGSNINLDQMAYRCPTAERVTTGFVENYELEFRRVATIIPKQDNKVPVLVWELKPEDEKSLDRYEGFPNMYRISTALRRYPSRILPSLTISRIGLKALTRKNLKSFLPLFRRTDRAQFSESAISSTI